MDGEHSATPEEALGSLGNAVDTARQAVADAQRVGAGYPSVASALDRVARLHKRAQAGAWFSRDPMHEVDAIERAIEQMLEVAYSPEPALPASGQLTARSLRGAQVRLALDDVLHRLPIALQKWAAGCGEGLVAPNSAAQDARKPAAMTTESRAVSHDVRLSHARVHWYLLDRLLLQAEKCATLPTLTLRRTPTSEVGLLSGDTVQLRLRSEDIKEYLPAPLYSDRIEWMLPAASSGPRALLVTDVQIHFKRGNGGVGLLMLYAPLTGPDTPWRAFVLKDRTALDTARHLLASLEQMPYGSIQSFGLPTMGEVKLESPPTALKLSELEAMDSIGDRWLTLRLDGRWFVVAQVTDRASGVPPK
ncbi:MAG: hypothetical protein JNK25_01500 [Phycisphaerae bacterium]|nr:hypothetical protein [Phycisphaerae bacterium]